MAQKVPFSYQVLRKTTNQRIIPLFSTFPPCLSRACLGKKIAFMQHLNGSKRGGSFFAPSAMSIEEARVRSQFMLPSLPYPIAENR